MSRLHLYLLAAALTVAGLGLFFYKAYVLDFPLTRQATLEVWTIEARVAFQAENLPVKLSMYLPSSTNRYAVLDEKFVSGGYGLVVAKENGNRRATWSIRKSSGRQSHYYQAVVRRLKTKAAPEIAKASEVTAPVFTGPSLDAAKSLIEEIKGKSADRPSLVARLIKELNLKEPHENAKVFLGPKPNVEKKVKVAVSLIEYAGIPARVVNGVKVQTDQYDLSKKIPILNWIEMHDGKQWVSFNPVTAESPVPSDWLPWWRGTKRLVALEGGTNLRVILSISSKVEEKIAAAIRRSEISQPLLFRLSFFSLPLQTQAVYRVMLLVPVGAVLLVLLRNVVGIKTFGTFMPVLIALSFRETGLLRGILLFILLVGLGLSARFYLEHLKLLVVPRLAAVLIIVVGLMASLSLVTHGLGGHVGLSVALFPMVIMTMTIERMSIVWEERGPTEALISGLGSVLTAALAFIVMNIRYIDHMVFVFPELLLVLLAITILLGRYTGYRLLDLYRFRNLSTG